MPNLANITSSHKNFHKLQNETFWLNLFSIYNESIRHLEMSSTGTEKHESNKNKFITLWKKYFTVFYKTHTENNFCWGEIFWQLISILIIRDLFILFLTDIWDKFIGNSPPDTEHFWKVWRYLKNDVVGNRWNWFVNRSVVIEKRTNRKKRTFAENH